MPPLRRIVETGQNGYGVTGSNRKSMNLQEVDQQFRVVVAEPERANLLVLMLASMLERRLAEPEHAARARKMRGSIVMQAGGMVACLEFGGDQVTIHRARPSKRPTAEIRGPLLVLLDAALGQRQFEHVLSGRLKVRGSLLVLLRLLSLLRV